MNELLRQRLEEEIEMGLCGADVESDSETGEFESEAVVIGCGDFRAILVGRKFLKRVHKIKEMDLATTASGSRTLSFWYVEGDDLVSFMAKKAGLIADLNKYIHHGATKCVIICHSQCGYWPEFWRVVEEDFATQEEFEACCASLVKRGKRIRAEYPKLWVWDAKSEFQAHYGSLLESADDIRSHYPEFSEVILLYVVLEERKPNKPIKIIDIDVENGRYEVVDIRTDPRMQDL